MAGTTAIASALLLLLPLVPGLPAGLAAGAAAKTLEKGPWQVVLDQTGRCEAKWNGKTVLVYAFATNQFKPYVKELHTLDGYNILLDSPPDHLHHHGLMFAIKANGVNFWEEYGKPGYEKPVGPLGCRFIKATAGVGDVALELSQQLAWVATNVPVADARKLAILLERRTLILSANEKTREVALEWKADFTAAGENPQTELGGAGYHGLGMRLRPEWDHVARHENSAGLPYSAAQSFDVTPALWSSVSHNPEGHPVTAVLASRVENPGEENFFSMLNVFTYTSATQNLDKQPIRFARGAKFSMRYLVLTYPAKRSRQEIDERYKAWIGAGAGAKNP